jgi:hypothetical protein
MPATQLLSAIRRYNARARMHYDRNILIFVFLLLPQREKRLFYG